jgi:hypothetical protein
MALRFGKVKFSPRYTLYVWCWALRFLGWIKWQK